MGQKITKTYILKSFYIQYIRHFDFENVIDSGIHLKTIKSGYMNSRGSTFGNVKDTTMRCLKALPA